MISTVSTSPAGPALLSGAKWGIAFCQDAYHGGWTAVTSRLRCPKPICGGFHGYGGTPIAGWFIRDIPVKWMMTRGTPYFRKPP